MPQCMVGYTPSQADSPPSRQPTPPAQTPPRQTPPGQTPPPVHAGIDMATAADGTHPTGMDSCLI